MHEVADVIERDGGLPLVHIADATAEAVRADGHERVGLLATGYTMERDFYVGRLRDRHGLDVLVPEPEDRAEVHRVIYEELCVGVVRDASRERYLRVVDDLIGRGATAVLLGCTEVDLLLADGDGPVPFYDTTLLQARRAVGLALAG